MATPFATDGTVDGATLREPVGWLEARGVDFLVPCGSNGEAELMTADERARVIEVVADEVTVPVLAGTGSPGFAETRRATADAAAAGADGGVLALANVVPEACASIAARHEADPVGAVVDNAALLESNHAITADHGGPVLKAAMRARGAPAGRVRRPYRPLDEATTAAVERPVDAR
jgi:dihydrodipicolinate synthase/N-acetylneuraminate lyase